MKRETNQTKRNQACTRGPSFEAATTTAAVTGSLMMGGGSHREWNPDTGVVGESKWRVPLRSEISKSVLRCYEEEENYTHNNNFFFYTTIMCSRNE